MSSDSVSRRQMRSISSQSVKLRRPRFALKVSESGECGKQGNWVELEGTAFLCAGGR